MGDKNKDKQANIASYIKDPGPQLSRTIYIWGISRSAHLPLCLLRCSDFQRSAHPSRESHVPPSIPSRGRPKHRHESASLQFPLFYQTQTWAFTGKGIVAGFSWSLTFNLPTYLHISKIYVSWSQDTNRLASQRSSRRT